MGRPAKNSFRLLMPLIASFVSLNAFGGSDPAAPCANVTMLSAGDFSALPIAARQRIRAAVRPSVEAIVSDKGMGMEGTDVDKVPLSAVQIGQGENASALYIVSWDDRSFGVNGTVWIVEVTRTGAKNLVRLGGERAAGYTLGGFGFEVLSPRSEPYPEIMIASSGFKDGGGAEAEAVCIRKKLKWYEDVACPVSCHKNLNER